MQKMLVPFLFLLPLLSASPVAQKQQLAKRYFGPFSVTKYGGGCVAGFCTYQFDVSFFGDNEAKTEPHFATTCAGNNTSDALIPCADPAVLATQANDTLLVQHEWMRGSAKLWVTAHIDLGPCQRCGLGEFDMRVRDSYGLVPVPVTGGRADMNVPQDE
ncbi:hypothetical protein PVAG01_03964 [Phlyctema vagabunda]|uniref:Uncharacterized protein n=1 Tax=Phlyctema vagabunda TaxID=108571 RepID=A0ABR4PMX4_9HELO